MIVTSLEQVPEKERLSWIGKTYSVDVETTGLNVKTDRLIGVALTINSKDYYFVLEHSTGTDFETKKYLTLEEVRQVLGPIFSQREVTFSAHNFKYDDHFLTRYNLRPQGKLFDTLIAGQLLDENRRNGLKHLTSLVDDEHSKYETMREYNQWPKGSPFAVPLKEFGEYACKDTQVTMKLYNLFRKQMPKDSFRGRSIQDVFNEVWMPLVPILTELESRGFRLDIPKIEAMKEEFTKKTESLHRDIEKQGLKMLIEKFSPTDIPKVYWKIVQDHDFIEEDSEGKFLIQYGLRTPVMQPTERSKPRKVVFNPGSRVQVNDLVFHNLDIPSDVELKYTPTGEVSVDADTLKIIKYYMGDKTPEYIDTLLELRLSSKFLGTYLEPFLDQAVEGRIHANFNLAVSEAGGGGTVSGRLSSSQPNLQNLPSRGEIGELARSMFIASEGMKLVVCDYSNVETRIFAEYSKDPTLVKAFNEGLDVHSLTASGINDIPYEEFLELIEKEDKEAKKMRAVAKTILFGSAYGMGYKKLRNTLLVQSGIELTNEESRQQLEDFNRTYQGMTDWKQEVMKYAAKTGFVTTKLGKKRRLPEIFSRDRSLRSRAQRQAVNSIIQGSAADALYLAMPLVHDFSKGLGGGMLGIVHDEIICEIPERYAEFALDQIKELMVGPYNTYMEHVKLVAEGSIGDNWYEAK